MFRDVGFSLGVWSFSGLVLRGLRHHRGFGKKGFGRASQLCVYVNKYKYSVKISIQIQIEISIHK